MFEIIAFSILILFFTASFIFFLIRGLSVTRSTLKHSPKSEILEINGEKYETLSLSHISNENKLFLLHFPGNPGLITLYGEYFSLLYEKFEQKINIIGISNKGLLTLSLEEKLRNGIFFCQKASLKDQVKYHLEFTRFLMKKYPEAKFIFTCHSLGSYIFLEILKYLPKDRVVKGIFLCPAIENLAKSPKGVKFVYQISKKYQFVAYFSSILLLFATFWPKLLKKGILSFISKDEYILESIIKLGDFNVALNYLNLGSESLKYVLDLNEKIIKQNERKLYFFYTMYDEWAPFNLFCKMKNKFKKSTFHLDSGDIAHAYILQGNKETVELVYKWMNLH